MCSMSKDKVKTYVLELLLIIILILALFKSNIISNLVLALILLVYMVVLKFGLRKRKIISVYSDQTISLMVLFALIYLTIFYSLGIYFGFYTAPVKFSLWGIWHYIIPFVIIIIASEVIRFILISQKGKESSLIAFVSTVLIDIVLYTKVYDLNNLEDILAIVGFVAFASISCNLFYNYMSKRFGYKGIICYRLITMLYAFIIPILPDVYIFFRSIGRMVYPYLMYLVLESTYSKANLATEYRKKNREIIGTAIMLVIVTVMSLLISCKFYYGILVIGSGSMTGSINKGDAVIIEKFDNQKLRKGNIIVFNRNNIQIVHRITHIEFVNDEYRYFTKGDANEAIDIGYVTKDSIVGLVKGKIPYIGYPTVWLKEMSSN